MALQLQTQNQPPPTQNIPQSGVTTDLSLATPGFATFKSTERQRRKRCLEGNQAKTIMNSYSSPRLELKLVASPNRAVGLGRESPARYMESESPLSSCVSSDPRQDESEMVVVGCPRCLMYVMMPDDVDSKCPRCKSHVLLDVVNNPAAAGVPARGGAKRVRKS